MKQLQQQRIAVLLICMMAVLVSAVSGSTVAREVYSWTDENGVTHYSDMPPDDQEAQIVAISETASAGDTQADAESDTIVEDDKNLPDSGPSQSAAEARREKIAREREERRETQAEIDFMCTQHHERLTSIEPHRRVFYKDESGKIVRMDDDERIAQIKESRKYIAKNCD